jgi:hypothetical protein
LRPPPGDHPRRNLKRADETQAGAVDIESSGGAVLDAQTTHHKRCGGRDWLIWHRRAGQDEVDRVNAHPCVGECSKAGSRREVYLRFIFATEPPRDPGCRYDTTAGKGEIEFLADYRPRGDGSAGS